jgi:hypothetical protein
VIQESDPHPSFAGNTGNRRLLEEDPVAELKASLVSELDEDDYYKILELKSVWIQNRVSPILKALTFQGDPGVRKLVDAIEHYLRDTFPGLVRFDSTKAHLLQYIVR